MSSPSDELRRQARLAEAMSRVHPEDRKVLQKAALDSQSVVKTEMYYSKIRISPTLTVSGSTTTLLFKQGTKATAFGYGKSDSLQAGGWPVSTAPKAHDAHTNLLIRNETNENEKFLIDGAAFFVDSRCDPAIVNQLMHVLYMSAGFGADNGRLHWGVPLFWPQGGGLFGAGMSNFAGQPSLADAIVNVPGFPTNGSPFATNYRRIPEGLVWNKKGQKDSSFSVKLELQEDVTITATSRAAASGIAAFTPPTADAVGTGLEAWVILFGKQEAERSVNI